MKRNFNSTMPFGSIPSYTDRAWIGWQRHLSDAIGVYLFVFKMCVRLPEETKSDCRCSVDLTLRNAIFIDHFFGQRFFSCLSRDVCFVVFRVEKSTLGLFRLDRRSVVGRVGRVLTRLAQNICIHEKCRVACKIWFAPFNSIFCVFVCWLDSSSILLLLLYYYYSNHNTIHPFDLIQLSRPISFPLCRPISNELIRVLLFPMDRYLELKLCFVFHPLGSSYSFSF